MFSRSKNYRKQVFRYFEPSGVLWEVLLLTLKKIGWLNKTVYSCGATNLFKVEGKTYISKIARYQPASQIKIILERKLIGSQKIIFALDEVKQTTYLEMATSLDLSAPHKANQIRALQATRKIWKQIDILIRDELERKGLKSYF